MLFTQSIVWRRTLELHSLQHRRRYLLMLAAKAIQLLKGLVLCDMFALLVNRLVEDILRKQSNDKLDRVAIR